MGLAAVLPAPAAEPERPESGPILAYVGTYTGPRSRGVYGFRFDRLTGTAQPLGCVAETRNPSFLAVHPSRKHLYAVNEVSDFQQDASQGGAVAAFRIHPDTGALTLLNQRSSGGAGPCHLNVDRTGRHVLVANYGGGSVAVLPVLEDGALGPATAVVRHTGSSVNPRRQREPHAHSVNLSPDNRFALVADLGTDRVMIYRFDAERGTLVAHEPPFMALPPGSGPRHLAFHPDGRMVCVVNELLSTVAVFDYAAQGVLTPRQTVATLPGTFQGENTTAEVVVHPAGRFVYASNRGHDSLATFAIGADGRLQPSGHTPSGGRTPRNFALDPSGYLWAANQGSDSVQIFRVEPATGVLTPTGEPIQVGSPVCIRFVAGP
jgi:6-phosphogluconolactonase